MFYDYAALEDGTQIGYSNYLPDRTVDVIVEKPVNLGFLTARCSLPSLVWNFNEGFSEDELAELGGVCPNECSFDSALCGRGVERLCLSFISSRVLLFTSGPWRTESRFAFMFREGFHGRMLRKFG